MNVIQLTKKIPHFHFKEIAARMSNVEMKLGCQTRFSLGQVDVLQIVYLHEILLQGKDLEDLKRLISDNFNFVIIHSSLLDKLISVKSVRNFIHFKPIF